MRRTVNVWVIIVAFACVLVGFFWLSHVSDKQLEELKNIVDDNSLRISSMENKQTELESTLAIAGTEAFIENQARTLYGYMMPDEIRFVISDHEALYGDAEEMPSP